MAVEFWKGKYWYLAIFLIILLGYYIGLTFWFGTAFLGALSSIGHEGKLLLQVMGLGVLGASIDCTIFFARDSNSFFNNTQPQKQPPTFIDPFGYFLHILGGSFTSLAFYLATKIGIIVITADKTTEMSTYGAWFIGLCGGIATQRVKGFLIRLVTEKTSKN